MAQAHIALEAPLRRPALMARWTAFREHARDRREAKRVLARMWAERERGRETGARV